MRHLKKERPCGFFVKLHKERGSGLFSVKDCNLRHSEHKKMEKPKPTHTLKELCKLPEIANVLKEKPTGKKSESSLRNTSWRQIETQSTG